MRSTRGRKRSDKYAGVSADRMAGISAPVKSNAPTHRPGSPRTPEQRARVAAWGTHNTNTRLKDGGVSSYWRGHERGYSA